MGLLELLKIVSCTWQSTSLLLSSLAAMGMIVANRLGSIATIPHSNAPPILPLYLFQWVNIQDRIASQAESPGTIPDSISNYAMLQSNPFPGISNASTVNRSKSIVPAL
jgi:hypothetical protein